MGPLLRRCVEMRIAIELSFGVVSGVGSGIDVQDGVHMPQGEGVFLAFFSICAPIHLNGRNDIVCREMYLTRE